MLVIMVALRRLTFSHGHRHVVGRPYITQVYDDINLFIRLWLYNNHLYSLLFNRKNILTKRG